MSISDLPFCRLIMDPRVEHEGDERGVCFKGLPDRV